MKFGPVDLTTDSALGAILAHSKQVGKKKFKKGRVLSAEDIEQLRANEIALVIAAQLEENDVAEDAAANALADAVCGEGVETTAAFTGRCNLFAMQSGLLVVDEESLNRINLVHEDLTVATLAPYTLVERKQMLATVKIIPFGVVQTDLDACLAAAQADEPLVRVLPFQCRRYGLIQTQLAGGKESVLDKATRVLQGRVELLGGDIVSEIRCDHETEAVASAIQQLLAEDMDFIMIAGASAIVDRRDIIPVAIEQSDGHVEHYGMPVDPGNLLLLGYHQQTPIVGLPGCARSPKYNGFDQVLVRLAAKLPVTKRDIMLMGAGGLLKEIASRGAPRAANTNLPEKAPAQAPRIAAIILAGGQSRRMGDVNKLLADVAGQPMLLHALRGVQAAQVESVVVVTGHEHEQVEQQLADYAVTITHNPTYAEGISTSLRAGLAAVPEDIDGVIVCLGDMPKVTTAHINRLIAAFDPVEGRAICVPTYAGKRGNPVLWGKRFFNEMREVAGDVGAKHLLGEYSELVCEVNIDDKGVLLDVDTPETLSAINKPT